MGQHGHGPAWAARVRDGDIGRRRGYQRQARDRLVRYCHWLIQIDPHAKHATYRIMGQFYRVMGQFEI
jgi:hypothetical protein